jgi:hypothetical protein
LGWRLWVAVFAAFEFALGLVVALKGGLADPVAGLGVVGFDALSGGVEVGELELGFGVALLSGAAIPLGGFGVVEG